MTAENVTAAREREELLLVMTAGKGWAVGSVWRITAKESDFYLDGCAPDGVVHLSVHGPGKKYASHRFHIKVDHRRPPASEVDGHVVLHGLPRKGLPFSGKQVGEHAWLVARIRWTWHLQERKYRTAALHRAAIPEVDSSYQQAGRLGTLLQVGRAWDVDLFVSYGEPYWPPLELGLSEHGNARLGPLRNDSGMWLTGGSVHRSMDQVPVPEGLEIPLPRAHERPSRIVGASLDPAEGFYWFTETISSSDLIEQSQLAVESTTNSQRT